MNKAHETNKVFVYGSLMRKMYNHDRFNFNKNTTFLGEQELKGFRLYDLGTYPGMVHTGVDGDTIKGEVYEWNQSDDAENTRLCIDSMETGAHYRKVIVETEYGLAEVYEYIGQIKYSPIVVHGDWKRYSTEENFGVV